MVNGILREAVSDELFGEKEGKQQILYTLPPYHDDWAHFPSAAISSMGRQKVALPSGLS
jgi:hypothetical protein